VAGGESLSQGILPRRSLGQGSPLPRRASAESARKGSGESGEPRLKGEASGFEGTPRYMAYELLAGGGYTEKVDIYSTALTLWSMMTTEVPHAHIENGKDLLSIVHQQQLRPPLQPVVNVWPDMGRVLACGWAHEPAERLGAYEMQRELDEAWAAIVQEESRHMVDVGCAVGCTVM